MTPPGGFCKRPHAVEGTYQSFHLVKTPGKNYTSRDPKQLRADGRAQTCQQLVAFCASTRMNQNDAVVNLARVALLHVCCWRASRFSTAPELRLGKRARWRASARARVNASVAAQARSHMGSSNTHVQFRHTCVYTWNTHAFTWNTKTRN